MRFHLKAATGPGACPGEGPPVNQLSQVLALLRKLVATDGDVTLEESRWLRRLVSELPPETEMDEEFDPTKLKALVEEHADSEELLRVMLTLSLADGQTSAAEWELIKETARLLEFPDDELETLRSETVLVEDPF